MRPSRVSGPGEGGDGIVGGIARRLKTRPAAFVQIGGEPLLPPHPCGRVIAACLLPHVVPICFKQS